MKVSQHPCARVTSPDSGWTFPDSAAYSRCVRSTKPTSAGGRARKPRSRPSDATLHIGAIWSVPEVLRTLGADPAEVCAEAGIDIELFDDPNNLISYHSGSHLFRVCVERTGCQYFGLLVGQKGGLNYLGLVGLLVRYSPDVGSALRSLVRYMHLHIQGAVTTLEVSGKTAKLDYEIYQADAEATDQIGDGAVAVLYNIMRALCGPNWSPLEVRLAHRKPDDVMPFRRFFQAPLLFDAEENALVFSSDALRHPLPEVEPELRRLLATQIEALEEQHSDQLPEKVRSILRTALLTDHGSASQIASLFSMHSRTLHRRLSAVGTSFRELVDESRFEIARQLLTDTDADVSHVANVLNYADASAFTRAFRRWCGMTPTQWRVRQNRSRTARR
jgi:AraC-like DNA-binding protein